MAAATGVVGDVFLLVKPLDAGFNADVQRIIDNAERQARFRITADTAGASQAVSGLGTQIEDQIGGGMARAAVQAAGFTAAIYEAQHAVEGVINKFAGVFDVITQAKAGFTSILQSQNAAQDLLQKVLVFAQNSPFNAEEVASYTQQLLGVGQASQTIIPLLTSLGDIVSSVGGNLQESFGRILYTLTQVRAIGKLTGQDARQFQNALIPITQYIADYTGKTVAEVKKLQETTGISADTVFAALQAKGKDVQGAMASATRTISGARSIFEDSVQLLKANQPVLQELYQNIVSSILKVAAFLESPVFLDKAGEFFKSVQKIVTELQPVFAQFANLAKEGALTSLSSFTGILNVLATVLGAIPEPVLRLLATTLATLATLKAPLALIQYVRNIKELGSGLLGGSLFGAVKSLTSGITAQGDAAEAAAVKMTLLDRANTAFANNKAVQKVNGGANGQGTTTRNAIAGAGVLAIGVAGQVASDGQGGERDAAGNVLSYGAIGATIGAAGGPVGVAVGAIAGAGIGAITSITAAFSKNAEETKKALADLAKQQADAYFTILKTNTGTDTISTSSAASKFVSDLGSTGPLQQALAARKAELDRAQAAYEDFNPGNNPQDAAKQEELGKALDKVKHGYEVTRDALNNYKRDQDALIKDPRAQAYFTDLQNKLQAINTANPNIGTGGIVGPVPGAGIINGSQTVGASGDYAQDFADVEAAYVKVLKRADALDFITSHTANEVNDYIDQLSKVSDAFTDITVKVGDFNTKFEQAAKDAQGGPLGDLDKQIASYKKVLDAASSIQTSFDKIRKEGANDLSINAAGSAIVNAAEETYAKLVANGATAGNASNFSNSQIVGQFKNLQSQLALSDEAFQKLLKSAGLWDTYAEAQAGGDGSTSVTTKTFKQLEDQLGLTGDKLKELLHLQGDVDPSTRILVDADFTKLPPAFQKILLNQGVLDAAVVLDVTVTPKTITSFDRAVAAATDLNNAVKAAQSVQGDSWDQLTARVSAYAEKISGAKSLAADFGAFSALDPTTNKIAQTNVNASTVSAAVLQIIQNAGQAGQEAFANTLTNLPGQGTEAVNVTTATQVQNATVSKQIIANFDALQKQLGLTTDKFNELIGPDAVKEYATAFSQVGAQATAKVTPDITTLTTQQAAEQARRDKTAKDAADEAAKKAAADAAQAAENIRQATTSLSNSVKQAADAIVQAAKAYTGSLKDRTQYDPAVSISRLIKNSGNQFKDITEFSGDLSKLQSRGVSQDLLNNLGIDNIADLKQVRKLVNASDADLATLAANFQKTNGVATDLATRQAQKQTHDTIVSAIVDAAKTLGLDAKGFSKADAQAVANNFNITSASDPDTIANAILSVLTSGSLNR